MWITLERKIHIFIQKDNIKLIKYFILNTKRYYRLNVKLNYYIYSYKWINFRNYNCVPIWLSDFQCNQFEILVIPPNFPNSILKNCIIYITVTNNITSFYACNFLNQFYLYYFFFLSFFIIWFKYKIGMQCKLVHLSVKQIMS